MRRSKAVLPKMLAACPNVVSYTLSMGLSWSSNAIKLPPDVGIFPCFLGRPTPVPAPAAPPERAAIPADTERYFLGGTFCSCLREQKGRAKVSHGKESVAWFPWRKTDLSSEEIHGSPQACLGSSSVLTQSLYRPGQTMRGNFLSAPSLRSSNIKTSTPWCTLEHFDFWVLQRTS